MKLEPVDTLSNRVILTSRSGMQAYNYIYGIRWTHTFYSGSKVKEGTTVEKHFLLGGHETCQFIIGRDHLVRGANVTRGGEIL